ncbi:hypothetical protein [Pseudomonas chlororaphis]|uniref:hypothetical protein n=1 Tax=Pseudomonas chlororaphis TaxID=587753 RepID=UPI0015E05DCE|nr:hypothetical protein [Pseudomonas chlororaphis]QLL10860.1 hypothetical protein H0I86_17520 [Pseudomonas chlororaphis subsp. aurantiaca]
MSEHTLQESSIDDEAVKRHLEHFNPRKITAGPAVTLSYLLLKAENFQSQENATARVYGNGNQASELLVEVEARDANGQVTNLPVGTVVELIPYTTNRGNWTPKPGLNGYKRFNESFPNSEIAEGTTPPDDGAATLSPATNDGLSSVEITTTSKSEWRPTEMSDGDTVWRQSISLFLASGNTIEITDRFAVRVRFPNEVSFSSNHPDVPYGGAGQNGRFNSSVYLRSVVPPRYTIANGGLALDIVEFDDPIYIAVIKNHYITLKHPTTKTPIEFNKVDYSPGPISAYHALVYGDEVLVVVVSGMQIPSRPNELSEDLPNSFPVNKKYFRERGLVGQRPNTIVYSVLGGLELLPLMTPSKRNSLCSVVDEYGNSFKLTVSLTLDPALTGYYSVLIDSAS